MIKIEADTLEKAYADAAKALKCSVTQLDVELIQAPKVGYFGMFKKSAIIVAAIDAKHVAKVNSVNPTKNMEEIKESQAEVKKEKLEEIPADKNPQKEEVALAEDKNENKEAIVSKVKSKFNKIIPKSIPTPFHHDEKKEEKEVSQIQTTAITVEKEINVLFDLTCFNIDKIVVSVYDEETLLIDFKGEDAALLIGKEGYRYKAISYMLFNWINTKYKVQLRLEIAEFLKNQEESVTRYIESVCETIDNEGRAQTKILDGVLIQIALKELREKYPEKYVVIRSDKDGLKYIIVNDYHSA